MNFGKVRISGLGLSPWYMILAFGIFPLRQHRSQDASLRRLVQIAETGNVILIFPQGRHVDPDDELRGDPAANFRTGVAHLARALGAPVLPFGVAGTERVLPPTTDGFKGLVIGGVPMSFKRGPIAIAFGEPLRRQSEETPEAFTARLQGECYRLTRQAKESLAEGSQIQRCGPGGQH
jgi:1-acyl-sn-glycerol-3-phosphate acyltransferase